jgi:hypothetical protein
MAGRDPLRKFALFKVVRIARPVYRLCENDLTDQQSPGDSSQEC